MDACEATKVVMSRVQNLDPENASKILGFILIQDGGDEEVIRLAFGPEARLISCVDQVKARLGLPSNASSAKPSTPLSNSVTANGPYPPRKIMIPDGPMSYAASLNGGPSAAASNEPSRDSGSSSLEHFYGGRDFGDQLSFLDDSVIDPSGRSDSLISPYGDDAHGTPSPHPHPFHRRSCSVNDAVFLSNLEEGGGGGKGGRNGFEWPCKYFARGFCKNGSSCNFLHCDNGEMLEAGSPGSSVSGIDEFLRMKETQQQRFAAMTSGGRHSFPYNKSVNILNDNQRCGPRNGFSQTRLGSCLSLSSQQIYLTFPADSTFNEEDVSSYFSTFGPVHDVRIPYQQKRMFGFVTFAYPETVKLILAQGNPHYVCESRVLVKPYKEKGKILEKKQSHQQHEHVERGDYSACLSPSGVDSRELFDFPIASNMLFNRKEMMLRRKLEQEAEIQHALVLNRKEMMFRRRMEQEAEIQHALAFQSRRMGNLKLKDLEIPQHSSHRFMPSFFTSGPISSSPRHQQFIRSHNFMDSLNAINQDVLQADDEKSVLEGNAPSTDNYIINSKKHQHVYDDDSHLPESLEHFLPDYLFPSPTKSAAEKQQSVFSAETDNNNITVTNKLPKNSPVVASSSPLGVASQFYSEATRKFE